MGIYYILLRRISSGTNNCVQRVFDKKHLFYNDISPHLKCLLSNERLDFCDKKSSKRSTMYIYFHSVL